MAISNQTLKEVDLGSIWLFSACSAGQLRTIRKVIEEVVVPDGKVLCKEGTTGREFFFIVEGYANVLRNGKRVAKLGPGQYFGELSMLDRQPRSATVISSSNMELLVLEYRKFHGLLADMPVLATKLLAIMASRLREADSKAFAHS
ncbi:MAG: cyclic nucleotide-binding domain-containing protein [Acidimicrobiales bacterium]